MVIFGTIIRIKDEETGMDFSLVLALFNMVDGPEVEVYIYFNFGPVTYTK